MVRSNIKIPSTSTEACKRICMHALTCIFMHHPYRPPKSTAPLLHHYRFANLNNNVTVQATQPPTELLLTQVVHLLTYFRSKHKTTPTTYAYVLICITVIPICVFTHICIFYVHVYGHIYAHMYPYVKCCCSYMLLFLFKHGSAASWINLF